MTNTTKPDYLAKAKQLSKEEAERLLSRIMGSKLHHRLEKNKISQEEALAKQLELEDEQLQKWRKLVLDLKAKEVAKKAKEEAKKAKEEAKKAKDDAKKAKEEAKKAGKPNTSSKAKSSSKVNAPAWVRATTAKTTATTAAVKTKGEPTK